jgi:5'-3' exonuclease|tara:strand:+ start:881 stop:1744 length:864 start_codon:yes stop_codon:yes gene_type:complete
MILVDMSQISLASMMMHLNMNKTTKPDESMVRHMILNSLRMYRSKFKQEFGELVLCFDSRHYWRRDHFPNYKAGRKKSRESSNLDWDAIFGCLNDIKQELKDVFPYKFVEVYGAEADDVIAALCLELEYDNGKTLILSGDKDFIQLHRFKNVSQYSPITKKMMVNDNPHQYLDEHILKGDSSDGVPNVLSPDNTFVDGLRQKPLSKKKIAEWTGEILVPVEMAIPDGEVKRNFQRNQQLIDLSKTPKEIFLACLKEYQDSPEGDRSKLLNYFTKKRLKNLTESIGEF